MADIVQAMERVRNGGIRAMLPKEPVEALCESMNIPFRNRLLTPIVTLQLFLLQVLTGNTAITHLCHLSGLSFAKSSYSDARVRLPLRLIRALLRWTLKQADVFCKNTIGPRIMIVDGSTFSMPDTPSLRERFGLPKGNGIKEGVAYPAAKFIGMIDLASGMFIDCLCGTMFPNDMGLVSRLHPSLRPGDILLGDRAFCSFSHVAMLNARDVFACFRLHQRRKVLPNARTQRWMRPTSCPSWLNPAVLASFPAFLDVRIVSYHCARRGFRTKVIHIATTLPDDSVWTDEKVAELYGHRWKIETCFRHLKTSMNSGVLKCKTVAGVAREHLMYLLAYNLIRLSMLRYALRRNVSVWRVSFIDALRRLQVQLIGLGGVDSLVLVPLRPGREEPRAIRRRMKEYDLLTVPRGEWKAKKGL